MNKNYKLVVAGMDEGLSKALSLRPSEEGDVDIFVNDELVAWFKPTGVLRVDRGSLESTGFKVEAV